VRNKDARLTKVRTERAILKMATAYFTKESQ
jgi:hypothetical protein